MEISLPHYKLVKLHTEIQFFEGPSKASKRQLQQLCGILSHCSKVVRGGRTFSRHVIDFLKGLIEGNPCVRLRDEFKADLLRWKDFASVLNGKEKIILPYSGCQPHVFTDSCLKGYGFVIGSDWQAGYFNSDLLPTEISHLDVVHQHWKNVQVPDQSTLISWS